MTINRRIGLGFTLSVSTDGTGGTYTALGGLVTAPTGPGAKADEVDISLLSDTYKQFAKSQINPGEVQASFAYDPDDATTTTVLTGLLTQIWPLPKWKITFPSGSTGAGTVTNETFVGALVGFDRKLGKDAFAVADITIKVSGTPGFTGE